MDCATANFFNVAALANPFCAQGRKSLCHIAVKIRITPWAARVVHAHRLIDFDFTVMVFVGASEISRNGTRMSGCSFPET